MSTRYERLLELYPNALVRAGRVYPAALSGEHGRGRLLVTADPIPADPDLLTLGAAHLADRLADDPSLTNGPTACWREDGADGVRVSPGRYLDMLATCDAVRAEFEESASTTPMIDLPRRALAHKLAGDPLTSGAGRDAAVGISVLLTVPGAGDGAREFVIGCRGRVSADRGQWHVAPSGMLELHDVADPIADTVATELAEELGLVIAVDEVAARLSGLGLVHDLLRLKPDLVVRLDLAAGEVPARLEAVSEFSELAYLRLERPALAAFWAAHEPSRLTPAAAGAIALLEASLPA